MSLVDGDQRVAIKNGHDDHMVLILPNKPQYVSVARLAVSGVASRMGFDVDTVEDIKLALAEACTNAIEHGCCEGCGEYKIEFSIGRECLTISIADEGCGMKKQKIYQPNPKDLREGGLGIFIINTLMDQVEIDTVPETGFTITMKKYLGV